MDIKYVVIESKGLVKAFPVTNSEYAEGIDVGVANTLITKHGVSKNSLTMPDNMVGVAKLHPDDKFDVEVGKAIARDRLLTVYNKNLEKALSTYQKGLERMLAITTSRVKASKNKVCNAKARLNL